MTATRAPQGYECKAYYKAALAALPTRAGWSLLDSIGDLTFNDSRSETDNTKRDNGQFKTYSTGLRDVDITFDIRWDPDSAQFQAVHAAYIARTALAVAVCDADGIAAGLGVGGNYRVTKFEQAQSLEKELVAAITLKPAGYQGDLPAVAGTTAATGNIALSDQPTDGNIVMISDGTTWRTFEFDTAADPGAVGPTSIRVKVGAAASNTVTALIAAINASDLAITAAEGDADSANLTNDVSSPAGNVRIVYAGTVFTVTGMAGGA